MKCLKWRRTAIPKYIDADKLVDDLQKYHRSRKNYGKSYETINRVIYSIISKQPYADVEPVVRCRDCKYKPTAPEGITVGFQVEFPDKPNNPCPCNCGDGWYSEKPSDNFFCAYGAKMDAEPPKGEDHEIL